MKPGFFTSETLGELPPLTRLLFVGLWCAADKEGRLLDRPKQLKAQLLPYDDCDVHAALDQLKDAGHILRYEAAGQQVIQVINFTVHQSLTTQEKTKTESVLPEFRTKSVRSQKQGGTSSTNTDRIINTDTDTNKNVDTNPASPNKHAKAKPEPDPRTDHPAIKLIQLITGFTPDKVLWGDLIEIYGDAPDSEKALACRKEWIERGYNPKSMVWAMNWYRDGIPERHAAKEGKNGTGQDSKRGSANGYKFKPETHVGSDS